MSKDYKRILNFFAEAGLLKRIRRSGWHLVGIKDAETVAEHSFKCVVIGYVIAKLENVPPYRVLLMASLNDIPEARINDLHKMSQAYFDYDRAQDKAFNQQINLLPKIIKMELMAIYNEYRNQKTKESIIARDADILECLIQAKEYKDFGFQEANKFMKKASNFLKTKSAKKLWSLAKKMNLNDWWQSLSKFKR